ncbi:NfeD family protein [Massilia sp. W12]|uniref:NfeD family protein n=1 Tax=Massilia sp. W12 TaxID=3126507 RepID=UPI0030D50DD0
MESIAVGAWINWAALAGFLVICELLSGTFYLLMLALGMVAGAVLAAFNFPPSVQMLGAALVAVIGVAWLHNSHLGWHARRGNDADESWSLDLGQSVHVQNWRCEGGRFVTRISYRGAEWDCELQQGKPVEGARYRIQQMRGNCLIVIPE